MTEQPEALRLADRLEESEARDCCSQRLEAAAELRRLHEENENLRSVMTAAAEEISAHWDAHCDAEGYGPTNLMHRLEKGIAAEYGYTAGAFAKQDARIAALEKALGMAVEALESEHSFSAAAMQQRMDALTAARQTLGGKHD